MNIKSGQIYNENCTATLARMPDNFIDMVITSPPYDGLRTYNGYAFDFETLVPLLYEKMKSGGVAVWVISDATVNGCETGTSFRQALHFINCGFNLHDTMIYHKRNPMPTAGNRYHQNFEYMFAFSKGAPKTFHPVMEATKYRGLANMKNRGTAGTLVYKKVERTTEKKVGNVFSYSIGGGISTKDKVAYGHPAIFPEALASDQIKTWSSESDLVYDPFMGSGTTAKVAHLLKRQWIGSEISAEYVEIATKRLALYTNAPLNSTNASHA
ncbi:MAG: site-specific DNA-methyltransferase [Rhizobacter sp.]|nr:site-specific DNA-methyltransferase [Chlorobiales bacterium]